MNASKAGAVSALLGALLFGCEDRNPAAVSDGVTGPGGGTVPAQAAGSQNSLMRWDIISVNFVTLTASPGGMASAFANDNSKITLTGTGTFRSNSGKSQAVTGGGRWTTYAPGGSVTGRGTYEVTGFVSFVVAPGTFPLLHDNMGNPADARAGLAVLKISYSDGSDGVLIVSCTIAGTPATVFEGITATKTYVDYLRPDVPGNDNRTLFHVLK
jgi:hypothetical protein